MQESYIFAGVKVLSADVNIQINPTVLHYKQKEVS